MGCAHQRVSSQDRRRGRLYRRRRRLQSDRGDHVQSDGRPGNRPSGPSGASVIRALYMAKTAVAGKHRRATDATNMSDERPDVREQSLTDGCANGGWRLFSPGRLLFRWLRSAAFLPRGGAEVARRAHNPKVASSNLAHATLFLIDLAMGLCFNIIVLVTVVEILGASLKRGSLRFSEEKFRELAEGRS